MSRYALFLGCNIPARVKQYDLSARAVLEKLDVELVDNPQFNCCGYPMRNSDPEAYLLSAAKNLALAEKQGLDMLVLCQCCYGSLKKAAHMMKSDDAVTEAVRAHLADHGLSYEGQTRIKHLLSVLYHDVGLEKLKEKILRPYKNLHIAVHYGCHALRPSDITEFDDPVAPTLIDELVEITGAKSVDWPLKLECCGAPAMGINDDLSMNLARKKLNDGRQAGAQYLCTSCPYCQIQFDTVQQMILAHDREMEALPAMVYPQILGLGMGIDGQKLGIGMNTLDITEVPSFLSKE